MFLILVKRDEFGSLRALTFITLTSNSHLARQNLPCSIAVRVCIIFAQVNFSSWGHILVALHHGEAKYCFQSRYCFSVIQPDLSNLLGKWLPFSVFISRQTFQARVFSLISQH
jgi:hypothetical protein